jgi:hypothetical protein
MRLDLSAALCAQPLRSFSFGTGYRYTADIRRSKNGRLFEQDSAPALGFEPRFPDSETGVLPLDETGSIAHGSRIAG